MSKNKPKIEIKAWHIAVACVLIIVAFCVIKHNSPKVKAQQTGGKYELIKQEEMRIGFNDIDWNDWALYNVGQRIVAEPKTKVSTFWGGDCPWDLSEPLATGVEGVDTNLSDARKLYVARGTVGIIDNEPIPEAKNDLPGEDALWATRKSVTAGSMDGADIVSFMIGRTTGAMMYGTIISPTEKAKSYTGDFVAKGIRQLLEELDSINVVLICWNVEDDSAELRKVIEENENVLFVCSTGERPASEGHKDLYPCSYEYDNLLVVMPMTCEGKPLDDVDISGKPDIAAPGDLIRVKSGSDVRTNTENFTLLEDNKYGISAAYGAIISAWIRYMAPKMNAVEVKECIVNHAAKWDALRGYCKAQGFIDMCAGVGWAYSYQ